MKRLYYFSILLVFAALQIGCNKTGNYPGGKASPYIAIFDVRNLHKGTDVTLTRDAMFGATSLAVMVVSEHEGNNLPEGIMFVQDSRRLSQLRGLAINLGAAAENFHPGDSVIVNIEGALLTRENGLLQIKNVAVDDIQVVSTGNELPIVRVPINAMIADPQRYEGTLSVIVKGGFNPVPLPTDVFSGKRLVNDGFGNMTLHTLPGASFANDPLPFLANFYGILMPSAESTTTPTYEFRVRTLEDIVILSSEINDVPIVISGFMNDAGGSDNNYEYIQFMATRDINFATTPFSVVTCNNAGTATPTGVPANGWATGGARTYKFNLTSGFAAKGTYFYVGNSNRLINGAGSTSMSTSNWIRSFNYGNTAGDGFGNATTNLLANSGNAFGIAVFRGTTVTRDTKPIDVMFTGANGSIYSAGPPEVGYRIANTDYYDERNPITLVTQPFYRSGSNTLNLQYGSGASGFFVMLGGKINPNLGRWTSARVQTVIPMTATSVITDIENESSTKIEE